MSFGFLIWTHKFDRFSAATTIVTQTTKVNILLDDIADSGVPELSMAGALCPYRQIGYAHLLFCRSFLKITGLDHRHGGEVDIFSESLRHLLGSKSLQFILKLLIP